MKNNQGFSIVELIIVIAIISILIGVGLGSISYTQGLRANSTAEKILSVIEECKTVAPSKYETSLIIQINDSGDIEAIVQTQASKEDNIVQESVTVGQSDTIVSFEKNNGGVSLLEEESLTIKFDRTTGAFDTTTDYCEKIYIERGGVTKTITLEPKTGKVWVE